MYTRKGREKEIWDLACDIAMESVLDGMYEKCIHIPQSPLRRETYLRIRRYLTGNRTSGASGKEERSVVQQSGYIMLLWKWPFQSAGSVSFRQNFM